MNASHICAVPRDTGYANVCQICGVPLDAGYFDVASFQDAPGIGKNVDKTEVEVACYELNQQYCGTLLYFTQFAEEGLNRQVITQTLVSNGSSSATTSRALRICLQALS